MTVSLVLDVIVGMVFTYFLLSAIASGIQEVIAGWLAWRGTYLSKAIDVIIDNDPATTWSWGEDFWRAHFTSQAATTAAERLKAAIAARPPSTPTPPGQAELLRVLSVHTHPLIRATPSNLPSYIPSRNFALALLETLRDGSQSALVTQVETTISKLPDGDLKQTLSLFLQNAGGDLDKFRNSIENWFDDAMDRVSGIYKRLSQYMMLVLGLLMALILNVDSINLARVLWQEPGIRSSIVAEGTTAAAGQSLGRPVLGQNANEPFPLGRVHKEMKTFEDANLPYGWSQWPDGVWGWVVAICGWVITALAIALGAPFWFGLLQQITNLRTSGPPPKRADAKAQT
jgi:hypothetical protein